MGKGINYRSLFEQAFQRVRNIRDPHASRPDNADLGWDIVERHALFNFAGKEYTKYQACVDGAKNISQSCLLFIIQTMLEVNGYSAEAISVEKEGLLATTLLALKEKKTSRLLLFKEIEECSFWKVKDEEPDSVREILSREQLSSCAYIYLVTDYAYLQIIGHNSDETDPGRGYNAYSLRWFFETYFGIEESTKFFAELTDYSAKVKEYLGYIFVKSLTPSSLISFRKNVEAEILEYDYESILSKKISKFNRQFELPRTGYQAIRRRFIEEKVYRVLLGTKDFAESLITAEWLFDSMSKAKAIDLTVVGMGYFKAVEQLLYELICLHRNEHRMIQKDFSRKDLPTRIELTDETIEANAVDSTIGSMANFFKENTDMFRRELHDWAKSYIREAIFDYKDLRNGYLHKDNIHDPEKIRAIRNATFELIFLLLGAQELSDHELEKLGIPEYKYYDDYAKLCEYVNYHSGELFYLGNTDDSLMLFLGCTDEHSLQVDESHIQYSGLYFKELTENGRTVKIAQDGLPKKIYLGKLVFEQGVDRVSFSPTKVKLIFENGKFVGPAIASEERLDY